MTERRKPSSEPATPALGDHLLLNALRELKPEPAPPAPVESVIDFETYAGGRQLSRADLAIMRTVGRAEKDRARSAADWSQLLASLKSAPTRRGV